MDAELVKRFLAQFDEARRGVDGWPDWMKEAAREAVASLPILVAQSAKDKQ
jgi:hypothetical protein